MMVATGEILGIRVMAACLFAFALLGFSLTAGTARSEGLPPAIDNSGFTPLQLLGEKLFFDTSLSTPNGQSCASCHTPANAFTDPNKSSPTSAGVDRKLFGNRNAPTAMYMAYSPALHYSAEDESYVGGQFWDGRASSLEDQAKQPLLNPLEMANPSKAAVITSVRNGSNAALFASVFGPDVFLDPDAAYEDLVQALASFERTKVFAPFNSKYDAYVAGKATLTSAELQGLHLFEDPTKGNCSACHTSTPSADGTPALFTDFTYDNLGIPKNPDNPFYTLPPEYNPDGSAVVDLGLGKTTGDAETNGQFKVGTLRDISLTGPYGHNGYFNTLEQIVDFYNTRDVKPRCADPLTTVDRAEALGCWPAAEYPDTVNHDELGNLGLTSAEVDDIVAFLGTLQDGWTGQDVAMGEPATLALVVLGVAGLAGIRIMRRRHPLRPTPVRYSDRMRTSV